jgi:TPR repeat protein
VAIKVYTIGASTNETGVKNMNTLSQPIAGKKTFYKVEMLEEIAKEAEQGNAKAQRRLGVSYHFGQNVRQNYKAALEWYSKAAMQGDAKAKFNLGFMYYNGEGVRQSYKSAVKWWTKAAEQGHALAQYNLGKMYHNGRGVNQSYKTAAKAEQGYKAAILAVKIIKDIEK